MALRDAAVEKHVDIGVFARELDPLENSIKPLQGTLDVLEETETVVEQRSSDAVHSVMHRSVHQDLLKIRISDTGHCPAGVDQRMHFGLFTHSQKITGGMQKTHKHVLNNSVFQGSQPPTPHGLGTSVASPGNSGYRSGSAGGALASYTASVAALIMAISFHPGSTVSSPVTGCFTV